MKAKDLFALLQRRPLEYYVHAQQGSHRKMRSSAGFPQLTFAFHDSQTISPGLVRKILVNDVGLSLADALALLS